MRRTDSNSGRFICFIINLALNWELSIPAFILLILHFVLHISLWWAAGAAALYILWIALLTFIIGWASSGTGKPETPRKNVNPYSAKTTDYLPTPADSQDENNQQ